MPARNFGFAAFILVVAGLIVSLVAMPLLLHRAALQLKEVDDVINSIPTSHVAAIDTTSYERALLHLRHTKQLGPTGHPMFDSGPRIACVRCGKPIRFSDDATLCPFCRNWRGPGTKEDYPKRVASCRDFIVTAQAIDLVLQTEYGGADSPPGKWIGHLPAIRPLRDTQDVAEITTQVRFIAKIECSCIHDLEIIFRNATNQIVASVCPHCFDVSDTLSPPAKTDARTLYFTMPAGLLAVVERYEREYYETRRKSGPDKD